MGEDSLGIIALREVILSYSFCKTRLERALDSVAGQVIRSAKLTGIEESSSFPDASVGELLQVGSIHSLLGAAHVGAFGGVDADLFALVDEGRHLDDEAGFSFGGLGDA